ncbi:hypothetical protein AAFF_G00400800 [Aldrovandia affinis]|uniref:Uncharacterized protein n=1 Tax=Aldrovandia affinis TaxID=143900 RepID=A0AAD7SET6_9TELE|nr:hypothetical protein AAFF_G00400800 [Aldrovandia affinis]
MGGQAASAAGSHVLLSRYVILLPMQSSFIFNAAASVFLRPPPLSSPRVLPDLCSTESAGGESGDCVFLHLFKLREILKDQRNRMSPISTIPMDKKRRNGGEYREEK